MTEEPRINGDPPGQDEEPRINGDPPEPDEEPRINGDSLEHDENEVETVDGVPVLAEVRSIARVSPASLPAIQVAAAAATGFVAGAATLALVKRRSARRLVRARGGPRRAVDILPIVASRTLLVDIHLIGKPGD
jgi:hypothetical protein